MKWRYPVLSGVFALCLAWDVAGAEKRRPNVVFILADDLGYGDLGCYGAPDIRTPNLDRLARDGVRFTDFYANGPLCSPTRCGFLTGRYQQRLGGLETAIPVGAKHLGLPAAEKTIASALQGAGYATAMVGKWHLGGTDARAPNAHGFDRFFGLRGGNHDYFTHRENNGEADLYLDNQPVVVEGYTTYLLRDQVLVFLEAMKAQPFFLYLAFTAPHFPMQGPEDSHRLVTSKDWASGSRATYVKMVEAMDAAIGEILAALEKHGLASNTLVVFTSDNGGERYGRNAPLAKGKGTLWEGGLRVPCLARWPGVIPAGTVSKQVAITMDWSASILKIARAKPPEHRPLDGMDLLPIISGKQEERTRTLCWRRVSPGFATTHRAVRRGDWKFIDEPNGRQYLYNLTSDIGEQTNLASQERAQVARLKKLLDRWEARVSPPLSEVSPKAGRRDESDAEAK